MARQPTTTDVFNAIGDACRRDILADLAERESTVGELAARLDLAQPRASKHLKVLRDVDLVRSRTSGRQRVYRINAQGFAPLQSWLTRLTASINDQYDRLDDHLEHLQSNATRKDR